MWFEAIGRVKQTRPGKLILGCTNTTAIVLAVGLTASPGQTGLVGGLGVDVDLDHGGLDVDVDLGRSNVDVDVGLGGGGSVGAGVNVGLGGSGVGVGVSVGLGGGAGTGPGGPGTGPGGPGTGPGVVVDEDDLRRAARTSLASGAMACAKDGNETAFNGFLVRDRDGDAFGWIHEATVSPEGKLVSVRLQSSGNACYKLSNANFRIRGDEIWTNADAVKFR